MSRIALYRGCLVTNNNNLLMAITKHLTMKNLLLMIHSHKSINSSYFSKLLKSFKHRTSSSSFSDTPLAPNRSITKELNTSNGEKHKLDISTFSFVERFLNNLNENLFMEHCIVHLLDGYDDTGNFDMAFF